MRSIILFFLCLGCGSPFLVAQSSGTVAPIQVVPFKLQRGYLILARCSIVSQKNLTAVVDTGTTETVLDSQLVLRLSLATRADQATFITREADVRSVTIPDLEMGPLRVEQLAAISTDLTPFSRELGTRIDVIIGVDVLSRAAGLTIDYQARKLRFGPAAPLVHSAPVVLGSHLILVDSVVQGRRFRLLVDTGFNRLLFYAPLPAHSPAVTETFAFPLMPPASGESFALPTPAAQGPAARMNPQAAAMFGDGLFPVQPSSSEGECGNLRALDARDICVGCWCSGRMQVLVANSASQVARPFDGLLGVRLLASHRLALDFAHGTMSWE